MSEAMRVSGVCGAGWLGGLRAHGAPVSALAKASAENTCRSSASSPTPMKWTGRREFVRQRHQDAALGRAVELGHDEAGQRHGGAEGLDLSDRVLPGGGVEHQ